MKDTSMLFTNPECSDGDKCRARSLPDAQRTAPHTNIKTIHAKEPETANGQGENYRVAKLHPHWLIGGRLE
jgi:hypothetical protein